MIQKLYQRAGSLRFRHKIVNVLALAANQPTLALTGDEWDRDPMLLGVANGTIDLHTGVLRASSPKDYIRTAAPTKWKGLNAPSPRWRRFLKEIFAGESNVSERIEFVQRLLGYGITGMTTEHCLPICWGYGRNGKDTLLETIKHTLGELADPVFADVLVDSEQNSRAATPHLYALRGKRIVWVNETNEGARLNAGQVKHLTGGGTITARPLYGSPVTFAPSHLLMLVTNHKPHADTDDFALWERLLLIPFTQAFVDEPIEDNEHKCNKKLPALLREEAPGILAWLVRGCLRWQSGGLLRPDSLKSATNNYQNDEDWFAQFLAERCRVSASFEVTAENIYRNYRGWADSRGMKPISLTAFGKRMRRKGFGKRDSHGVIYTGVELSRGANWLG